MPPRRLGRLLVASGLSLLAIAAWGLWRDIEWIAQPFYAWAWWGYIFAVDGLCAIKRGDSILTTRRRFVAPICFWSVTLSAPT